jgi:glycolate oxidase
VTEITLRLLPQPRQAKRLAAWFDTTEAAAAAIAEIASTIRPSLLEYMDRTAINAVEDMMGIGLHRDAAAFVLAGTDDADPDEFELRTMRRILLAHQPALVEETDPARGDELAEARRSAIPAVEAKGRLLLSDVGVPIPRLAELIEGVEHIASRDDVTIAFIAHAGDGNTHPLVVFDPNDEAQALRAQHAYGEIMTLAIRLGGTITGEHGVGKLKRPWLVSQIGEDVLDLGERIKHALDPVGILNPGAVFSANTDGSTTND